MPEEHVHRTGRRNVVIIKVGDSMHNTFATSAPRPGTCQRTTSGVYLASEPSISTTGPVRNVAAAHTGRSRKRRPDGTGGLRARHELHETVCAGAGDNCTTPVSATPGHTRADPTQNRGLAALSQSEINVQPQLTLTILRTVDFPGILKAFWRGCRVLLFTGTLIREPGTV